VEGPGRGRTPYDAPEVDFQILLDSTIPPGELLTVHIHGVRENGDLEGNPVREPAA
jgi:hypothetical protein